MGVEILQAIFHQFALYPAPELKLTESWGPKPERPGLVPMGTDMDLIPMTGLAVIFSPTPRTALTRKFSSTLADAAAAVA